MADFEIAVNKLLIIEGGDKLVNNSADPGGLTRWGISKRSYPDVDITNLSRDDAIAIYQRDWWCQAYELINDQDIANKVFNLAVNMGKANAVKCLQRAIRAAQGTVLAEDGLLGRASLVAVNGSNPDSLLAAFKSEAACYYRSINNPTMQTGWLNRAYS